jgi:hypothetical protein
MGAGIMALDWSQRMEGGSGGGATIGTLSAPAQQRKEGKGGAGGRRRGPDGWGQRVSDCGKKKRRGTQAAAGRR